ncbi:branched-chain amino acid transaminase [Candidatus Peregrinibacteria bacterium]|nr:branched-chain amino acid transaminase [Candidatus Peregrinibacteria bacterium]
MEKVKYIWMDNKYLPWKEANIHVLNHTMHYGGGVFEGIRFYETPKGPAVFRLHDHIKRLFYSASCLDMKIDYSISDLSKATLNLIKKCQLKSGYIRPIIVYGYGKMGLNPSMATVNVIIAAWPWGSYLGDKPVKVMISKYKRIYNKSTIPDAKITGHYHNSILASLDVKKQKMDEALLLDHEGILAEGPGENIFLIKNKTLYTPKKGSILPGITRDTILKLANKRGIKTLQKSIKPSSIKQFDEAFFTGTAAEVTAIKSINGHNLKSGNKTSLTNQIKQDYQKIVRGDLVLNKKWLSFIEST